MESLDPIDESFIKFKYDLKFSSVNRREFKRKQEVKVVQNELLEQDPTISELFPVQKALPSLKEIDRGLGGLKNNLLPSATSDSKSREAKKTNSKKKNKGAGTSSDTTGD